MEFSLKKKSKGKFRYPRPVALSLSLSLAVSLHFSGDFFSSIVSVVPRPLYLSHALTLSLSDRLPSLFFPSLSPANESSVGLEGKCLLHASDLRAISKTDAFFPFFFREPSSVCVSAWRRMRCTFLVVGRRVFHLPRDARDVRTRAHENFSSFVST